MNLNDEPIKPEAMNLTQLANQYKVCPKTFKKWIKPFMDEIQKAEGTYIFTPDQVQKIYKRLGTP